VSVPNDKNIPGLIKQGKLGKIIALFQLKLPTLCSKVKKNLLYLFVSVPNDKDIHNSSQTDSQKVVLEIL
jgi:hypothetical protein